MMGSRNRTLPGRTRGWHCRCHGCGHTTPLEEAQGLQRLSLGRRLTLAWCSNCASLRLTVVERAAPRALAGKA